MRRIRRRSVGGPGAVLGLVCAVVQVAGAKEILTDFSDAVRRSDVIARISIEGSRDLEYFVGDERRICGRLYRALVVESLKGERGAFEVLVPEAAELQPGREYLAFLWRYTAEDRERTDRSSMSSSSLAYHECRIRGPELMPVDEDRPSIIPFAKEAKPPADLPLQPVGHTPISWLRAKDGSVAWGDAKRAIEEELRHPEPEIPVE